MNAVGYTRISTDGQGAFQKRGLSRPQREEKPTKILNHIPQVLGTFSSHASQWSSCLHHSSIAFRAAEPMEFRLVLLRQAHKFDASQFPLAPSDLRQGNLQRGGSLVGIERQGELLPGKEGEG